MRALTRAVNVTALARLLSFPYWVCPACGSPLRSSAFEPIVRQTGSWDPLLPYLRRQARPARGASSAPSADSAPPPPG
jgi:hypothetical protein